jgi:hypothetical protein
MAEEFEELFSGGGIESVPFVTVGKQSGDNGYYTLSNVDLEPLDPRGNGFYKFDGVLTKEGTRESKRRAVKTSISQVENSFGNTQTALVGVPAAASDIRWFESETEQTEPASVVETRTAEHGDVEVVDALTSSFDSPALVFDLPYQQEGKVDTVVWDDHDRSKLDVQYSGDRVGDATVGVSAVGTETYLNSWQWCFSTAHEFAGDAVVDNGFVRLWLGDRLRVDHYQPDTEEWALTSLGDATWQLDDWNLTRIGPARVTARCRFYDSTQSPTQHYELDMDLPRGYQSPVWIVPENQTPPTPSGLVDLLSPVANESDYSPQAEQGLVARAEVRA